LGGFRRGRPNRFSQTDKQERLMPEQSKGFEKDEQGAVAQAGLFGKVVHATGIVFSTGLLVSAIILIIEIILRYVFNAPTIWAHETVIFISATTFTFGGLYAIAEDRHIRGVLLYDQFSKNMRRIANVIISIISRFAVAMFSWAAWLMVVRAVWTPQGDFRLERSGSAWNPPTPGLLKLFLLFILLLMTVQFLILAVNFFREKE
jgi:TRAP-type C4-dicarboxylate transport system permease small subunit